MRLIGSFFDFANRVLGAAKTGRLPSNDQKKLERLLTRTGKRNLILAKGLLSALTVGGATREDTQRLAKLLEKASERITQDREPFNASDKKDLESIFLSAYLSRKAAHWFASQMDELLAEEIDEFISGKRMMTIPTKKTLGMPEERPERKKQRQ